jgi:hypothetical protein
LTVWLKIVDKSSFSGICYQREKAVVLNRHKVTPAPNQGGYSISVHKAPVSKDKGNQQSGENRATIFLIFILKKAWWFGFVCSIFAPL